MIQTPAPPHEDPRAVQALLVLLSVIAGCTDVISYLGLNGLFASHITGNLVLLASHVRSAGGVPVAKMLALPVYITVVGLTTLLAARMGTFGIVPLRTLLLLQFLLLAGYLALCVAAGSRINPNAATGILAGILGVSAMAVQNALVQLSFEGMPATAMMTGNVTRFAIDIGHALCGRDAAGAEKARQRAARTLSVILGFAAGCGFGAACEAVYGLRALALPAGLALLALLVASSHRGRLHP